MTLRRKKSVDRSFLRSFLSILCLSLSDAERTLGIFFVKYLRANEARSATSAHEVALSLLDQTLPFFPHHKRNEWITDRSITAALIKYSIPFSLRIPLLISLVFLQHRTYTNIFEHFLSLRVPYSSLPKSSSPSSGVKLSTDSPKEQSRV